MFGISSFAAKSRVNALAFSLYFCFCKRNVKAFTRLFLLPIFKEEEVGNLLMAAGFQAQVDCENDVCVG